MKQTTTPTQRPSANDHKLEPNGKTNDLRSLYRRRSTRMILVHTLARTSLRVSAHTVKTFKSVPAASPSRGKNVRFQYFCGYSNHSSLPIVLRKATTRTSSASTMSLAAAALKPCPEGACHACSTLRPWFAAPASSSSKVASLTARQRPLQMNCFDSAVAIFRGSAGG